MATSASSLGRAGIGIPKTCVVLALGISGILALSYLGFAFRLVPWLFMIVGVLVPLVAWVMSRTARLTNLTRKGLTRMRATSMAVVVVNSLIAIANSDHVRDNVGNRYVDGYAVDYSAESDEFGRESRVAHVATARPEARFWVWVFEWVTFAFVIGSPYLTWRLTTRTIEVAATAGQSQDA